MIESLIALMAPHECLVCTTEGALLCDDCMEKLPLPSPICYRCEQKSAHHMTCKDCRQVSALHSVTPVAVYEGIVKDLIWRLKFGRAKAAAHDIARHLCLPVGHEDHPVAVMYVPTATSRTRVRGYDQARLIARSFARLHQLPLSPALVRTGQHRQVGSSGEKRRHQMRNSFRIAHGAEIADTHIILVDDVTTSGATLEAVAEVLKQAGVWRIDACVFARAGTSLRS